MKTAEEKAERYANEMYQDANEWDAWYYGYMGGYSEAMRWRDPRVENPQNGQLLLTKMSEDINSVDICRYKNGRYYSYMQNQSSYFTDKPIFREDLTDAITGWRPIE